MSGPLPDTAEVDDAESRYMGIDHVAIAVRDLDPAIALFRDVLGFRLVRRLTIRGKKTGMLSAEMEHNGIKFVLCQGTEPESQVSRLIEEYGPGVAHIAMRVADAHDTMENLQTRGMSFDTNVIEGQGLKQTFTSRCRNSGLSFEFIQRDPCQGGFVETNVQQLFDQLETQGTY